MKKCLLFLLLVPVMLTGCGVSSISTVANFYLHNATDADIYVCKNRYSDTVPTLVAPDGYYDMRIGMDVSYIGVLMDQMYKTGEKLYVVKNDTTYSIDVDDPTTYAWASAYRDATEAELELFNLNSKYYQPKVFDITDAFLLTQAD